MTELQRDPRFSNDQLDMMYALVATQTATRTHRAALRAMRLAYIASDWFEAIGDRLEDFVACHRRTTER